MNQTIDLEFTYDKIIIGFSFLFWAVSVVLGFNWLENHLTHLDENIDLLDSYLDNKHQIIIKEIKEKLDTNTGKAIKLFKYQKYFFYAGMILFIGWYLLKMYQNTIA